MSVSFKRLVPSVSKPNNSVIGVDRGINYIATDGKKAQFFGGGPIKHVRNQYSQTRAKLQQKLADAKKARRNTRSLRRLLKRLSGREARVGQPTTDKLPNLFGSTDIRLLLKSQTCKVDLYV